MPNRLLLIASENKKLESIASKIRFNPALNRAGEPIAARYGWRQDFRGR